MKNFRTFDLAVEFYRTCRTLELPAVLEDQLIRAASSIALNLAEGRGRHTVPDQRRFFSIALGSLRECEAVLVLSELEGSESWRQLDKLGAHLYKLIQSSAG
jgi:four helix bundle protein